MDKADLVKKKNAFFLHFFLKKFGSVKKKQYLCTVKQKERRNIMNLNVTIKRIAWDVDADEDLNYLPKAPFKMSIEIDENADTDDIAETIADELSNQFGYCHYGFSYEIERENEFEKVTSLEHLKQILEQNDGVCGEFFVQLQVGRSWKTMSFSDQTDKNGNYKIWVENQIDGSHQILTENNLFNEKFSNIGTAINNGQFYFAWC